MHLPYTDRYPEAVAVASTSVAAALTMVLWARPFRSRAVTALFGVSIWVAALFPRAVEIAQWLSIPSATLTSTLLLQSLTIVSLALLLREPRWFGALALAGQVALILVGQQVQESDNELCFAQLAWFGALLGVHALRTRAFSSVFEERSTRSFPRQDGVIFILTVSLALSVNALIFGWVVFNGDEVANSFQANVYGHLRAYAPLPPCPSMFENYWVFRYQGRAFSQYTPGWPMFMAPFQRLGVISLAGPVMAGITAVGIARLSRRVAVGLGGTAQRSERIIAMAGPLGAALAMLGPSMILNGASRFSHTMVCGCFAWAVESLCVISGPQITRSASIRYGLLLGAATSLGLATRPADGALLGIGVFLYFVSALLRRRIHWRSFVATCVSFGFFAGLTLVILRLQIGKWFHTAYAVAPLFHYEAEVKLSLPLPNQWKFGIPLATGAYCWWPATPALAACGLIQALGGTERRVPFMLTVSTSALIAFYCFVEFGRGQDDGLGPRYVLPTVVALAAGGAGILAPLFVRLSDMIRTQTLPIYHRFLRAGPALGAALALLYGVWRIAPLTYPVAYAEHKYATAPLRGARKMNLKNAIVMLEPGKLPAYEMNLAQNPPFDLDTDVLFLIRRSEADDECARTHFPGRKWYRAGIGEKLTPY